MSSEILTYIMSQARVSQMQSICHAERSEVSLYRVKISSQYL